MILLQDQIKMILRISSSLFFDLAIFPVFFDTISAIQHTYSLVLDASKWIL